MKFSLTLFLFSTLSLGNVPDPGRSICGTNDMLDMVNQAEPLQRMGRPIGRLRGDSGSSSFYCTGTLVSKDLFLTARHCLGSCQSMSVTFGFLKERQQSFKCQEILEAGGDSSDQDYLVMRLEGNPGLEWGWYELSDRPLSLNQPLLMIHHPEALPMKVSIKDCVFRGESSGFLNHRCDTNSGSSGSAVLVPDYGTPSNTRIVAVHAFGGCTSSPDSYNSGPSIRHLASKSALIRSLIKD